MTGRDRDDQPALQRLPIRDPKVKELAEAFAKAVPPLLDVDYETLELRIAAALEMTEPREPGR